MKAQEHPPLWHQGKASAGQIALLQGAEKHSYADLLQKAQELAQHLLQGQQDLQGARIAYLCTPGWESIVSLWGIWLAGGTAVPIGTMYPVPEVEYILDLSKAKALISSHTFENKALQARGQRKLPHYPFVKIPATTAPVPFPEIESHRPALMLFTSGTTSRPKGVIHTHGSLQAQVHSLQKAWSWSPDDHILCVLPLHHTHGLVNIVCCALTSGARISFLPQFEAEAVWKSFMELDLSLFMAVPTVYKKLIDHWEQQTPTRQHDLSQSGKKFRLMVSGSAALPVSVLEKWESLTGQRLLERYGMTEIGMCLSNPYNGERRPGTVGQPLPGVQVRLIDEAGQEVSEGQPGQIITRGPNLFAEYFQNPKATQEAFLPGGWFKTGDIAVVEKGYFRILGRSSVDILKSGGYKISALEIEEALRQHPAVADCAVVGLPDPDWGQRIAAAIISPESNWDEQELISFLREKLAPYKIPKTIIELEELPRNALGKVQKKQVVDLF